MNDSNEYDHDSFCDGDIRQTPRLTIVRRRIDFEMNTKGNNVPNHYMLENIGVANQYLNDEMDPLRYQEYQTGQKPDEAQYISETIRHYFY